ncbi:MAG: hypothetical protein LAQ69_17160 [Acidobacteriia bacterium]|nr:hypothetical protein [Terriglobia bacterium]
MNILQIRKAVSGRWIGAAVAILLFACSAIVHAQEGRERKKRDASSPPASDAARPAPRTPPAAANPGPGPARQQNPERSGRQNPERPAQQRGGEAAPQNAGHPNRPDPGQGAPQNVGRPNRPDPGQGASQNAGRPNRPDPGQAAPQNVGRPNRPDPGQGAPQNVGRPNRQNAGQPARDQGRPAFQNSGRQPDSPGGGRPGSSYQQGARDSGLRPQAIRTSNGGMVRRDSGGRVREVHTPGGAVITHRSDGFRRVEMARPGNRVVVTNSHGRGGYIQRPLMVSNRQYIQRTYSLHGVSYARVYRPVTYRGMLLHVYTPMHYYRPAFYSYVYNPWARPIVYNWAWAGRPWYGYYNSYFTPYPTYTSPILWLTDYLIGSVLEQAYEDRTEGAGFALAGQAGITPDVKRAIAEEIRRQLDLERSEGQSQNAAYGDGLPLFADNTRHVLVVSNSLEVSSSGGECMITEGDVLELDGAPPPDADTADVVVLASKGADCRRGSIASVPTQELQEMQNQMRATIDQGLADFQSRHGQSGLPALPPSAAGSVVNASFAASVTPDANVATELTQVAREADQAEQEVVNQTNAPGSSGGPVTISFGQTIEEVVAILSQPQKVVDLGAKKIYVYKDMKITFTDGRVSDVQ